MTPASWVNDRLPELLWGCLIISVVPRVRALNLLRGIASLGFPYRDKDESANWRFYLSEFPDYPEEIQEGFVDVVKNDPLGYASLRPLLLLSTLPGRDRWMELLGIEPQERDWETLANAVLTTLDHQSQEATDVRWVCLLFKIALGRMIFSEELRERAEEIIHYPNRGDMRSVRPSIRAMEISFAMPENEGAAQSDWPSKFWKECFDRTECIPADPPRAIGPIHDQNSIFASLEITHNSVLNGWFDTVESSGVDAKHDGAFGVVLYALAALQEMLVGHNAYGITGRALLRTIVESHITLAYLATTNDLELWRKYRAFGIGQAKLALLKLDNVQNHPEFAAPDVLESLCNEDYFQEFVPIELGHWCGLDLRKMAEASDTKEDYDRLYGWPSSFVHAHWGAVRDSTMMHCFNPLHRLHRIPLPGHRMLEGCVADGIKAVNAMFANLASIYPSIEPIPNVQFSELQVDEENGEAPDGREE